MWADRTHFVYRIFDDRGLLLYVGCTGNFGKRSKQHRAEKPLWMSYAHSARMEGPFSKEDAFRRESAAIEAERPYFNVLLEHKRIGQQRRTMHNRLMSQLRRTRPDLFGKNAVPMSREFVDITDEIDAKVELAHPPADAAYRHRVYLNDRVALKVVPA